MNEKGTQVAIGDAGSWNFDKLYAKRLSLTHRNNDLSSVLNNSYCIKLIVGGRLAFKKNKE